jgi:hypothetical protein
MNYLGDGDTDDSELDLTIKDILQHTGGGY